MALTAVLLCVSVGVLALPMAGASAAPGDLPYNVVSDSYYHVDPAAGLMTVKVEATFYNKQSADLIGVPFWTMPNATDIVVTSNGATLTTTVTPSVADQPAVVVAALPGHLKSKQQVDVSLTYSVPQQANRLVNLKPGSLEAMFVSQGKGSFVFVDVPVSAENYFDPGCVPVASQPSEVTSAGYKRWVCGEVLRSIFNRSDTTESACANLLDKCRQSSVGSALTAFGQSITNIASRGLLEADIPMSTKTVHLTFRFFKQNHDWADVIFATAKEALPKIEAVFGYPYPFDTLSIRESTFIESVGALGLAYNSGGDVLITPTNIGIDQEVAIHELSHQWANGANLSASWEAEGLAEYAAQRLAPEFGITPALRPWQSLGYKDNLSLWGQGSEIGNADYWYGKSAAFFFAYAAAIGGPENMSKVLAGTSPSTEGAPFDGRWFMDAGEDVSGANLDSLFMDWVFNPATAGPAVADRRAARDLVAPLRTRATAMGLSGIPADIQDNLRSWTFDGIADQVTTGETVLDSYRDVVKLAENYRLGPSTAVAKAWGSRTLTQIAAVIEDQRQAIQVYVDALNQLPGQGADSPAGDQLAESRARYDEGDFSNAKRLAAGSLTTGYNQITAGKMIGVAKDEQASYRASFLSRIGLLFVDPARDLSKAEAAYAAGDPATALTLSRSAYDAWHGAGARGMQRLAVLTGLLCFFSFGGWWLLRRKRRLSGPHLRGRDVVVVRGGHMLDDPESRRASWKDWEND